MNGLDWIIVAIKKYSDFRGRSRRKEFWWFYLFLTLANVATDILDKILGTTPWVNGLFGIAFLLPSIAVVVRRLHDTNRSGWWCLLVIVNIVFLVQGSDPSENRFGPCPKSAAEMQGAVPSKSSINMGNLEQIENLARLRDKGILTDEEFQAKKAELL